MFDWSKTYIPALLNRSYRTGKTCTRTEALAQFLPRDANELTETDDMFYKI